MMNQIVPPLAVHFIWHPDDKDEIFSVITEFRRYLTRDIDRPFSRELNIPTFLYSSCSPKNPPKKIPKKLAEKDVMFLFTSKNTLMDPNWIEYIDNIPTDDNCFIIPIAVDLQGTHHSSTNRLKRYNFIKAFNWNKELKEQYGIFILAHELYRFGLNNLMSNEVGIDSSIKIFLSHAKRGDTGLKHAKAIKNFIDNSNINKFFDAYDISPGFRFDKEIEQHIKTSTLIAIVSDAYSSRYWCQREILCAKKEKRPIILVDSLENYEDRVFPAASNIPCVHITDEPLDDKNILRILIAALLETIRFQYANLLLNYYKQQNWIKKTAHIFSRPPEIQEVLSLLKKEKNEKLVICYPEPALYKEETEWAEQLGIHVSTPLWSNYENQYKKITNWIINL